jgi:hypothetical protein
MATISIRIVEILFKDSGLYFSNIYIYIYVMIRCCPGDHTSIINDTYSKTKGHEHYALFIMLPDPM